MDIVNYFEKGFPLKLVWNTPLLILMHEVRHNANPKRGHGRSHSSGGRRAPIASFWVRVMTSCINIREAYNQGHRGEPLLFTISALGSFTYITQQVGTKVLHVRPIHVGAVAIRNDPLRHKHLDISK